MIQRSLFAVVLLALAGAAQAQTLFSDDFSGDTLSPEWEVQRGHATMDNGWVRLQGSTLGTRDAFILTHEGSSWSDYTLTTRFNARGGGQHWFNSLLAFRVQELSGWGAGTHYRLDLFTPRADPGFPNSSLYFLKIVDGVAVQVINQRVAPALFDDRINTVSISAVGGDFDVLINGQAAAHFHDDDPILTGGIALGAVWESTTRYDHVRVTAVPEAGTAAMLAAGLAVMGLLARRRPRA